MTVGEGGAIATVTIISIAVSTFILFTLTVIFRDKKMRRKPATVPIVSFLLAAFVQGMLAFPVYVYRKMEGGSSKHAGVCDAYRVPYFFCGHILTMSLFFVSLDRLFVITRPYMYERHVTAQKFTLIMVALWIVTSLIDIIPFFDRGDYEDNCLYRPNTSWGVTVIIIYIIIPLITIITCYAIIWWTAVRITMKDNKLRMRTQSSKDSSQHHGHMFQIAEMKATKTSSVLIATYIICWAPLGIFYMIDHFCSYCYSAKEHLSEFRMSIKLLAFASSFLAPAVYCWWNKEFRKSAKKLFRN